MKLVLGLVSSVSVVACSAMSLAQTPLVSDVRDAWAARQQWATSLHCEWTSDVTYLVQGKPPATYKKEGVLDVDGTRVRHTSTGVRWLGGEYRNAPYISVFVEGRTTQHFDRGQEQDGAPPFGQSLGVICQNAEFPENRNYYVEPLMLHFRILTEEVSAVSSRSITLADEPRTIDGGNCVVVAMTDRSQPTRWLFWMDPERGFSIIRYSVHLRDQVMRQCDIQYTQEGGSGDWVPREWQTTVFHGGRIHERITSRISAFSINQKIDASTFVYEYPVGTLVTEWRNESEHITHIVRDNGVRRPVTKREALASVPYDVLVATEPDGALGDYIALETRLAEVESLENNAQNNLLADLEKYCRQFPERGDVLALTTVDRLAKSSNMEMALRIGDTLVEQSTGNHIRLPGTVRLTGTVRRDRLPGNSIQVLGKTLDGDEFKWEDWRGKATLITFWFVGCRGCREDLPQLKQLYACNHEKGFDIVGISIDSDRDAVRKYVEAEGITWTNLCEPGGEQLTVRHYGISQFPYHVLVDQKGVVVALNPDMDKLPSMVEELMTSPRR